MIKAIPYLLPVPFIGQRYLQQVKKRIRWKGIHIKKKIFDGNRMKLYVNDWVQKNLFIYGKYEKNEIGLWAQLAANRKTIVDVGCHVGYYSLVAAKAAPSDARIYSFEPVQQNFEMAKENIALNNYRNIFLYQTALSNTNGVLTINVGEDENRGMSSINFHDHLSGKKEEVKTQTLDSFCNEQAIQQVDLIKIDVEGSEYYVLQGMKATLEQNRPVVLIEILEQTLTAQQVEVSEVYHFFNEQKYKPYSITQPNELQSISRPVAMEGLVCFWPAEKAFDSFLKVQ